MKRPTKDRVARHRAKMTLSSPETSRNLASAARAILRRVPAEQGRAERWYVLLADERHSRVAAAFDSEGFPLLFASAAAARCWLGAARLELPVEVES